MKIKALRFTNRHWVALYTLVGLATIILYFPARAHMIVQDAWIYVVQSPVSLNFIFLFGLWGIVSDKISRRFGWKTNSKKSWAMFAIGLASLILFFKFIGGYETIW